jgi:hypothetical protein
MTRLRQIRNRRLRGLGDNTDPWGIYTSNEDNSIIQFNNGYILDSTSGNVYDTNGNVVFFNSGGVQEDQPANLVAGNYALQYGSTRPPNPTVNSISKWFSQPVAPGWPSGGVIVGGAAVLALLANMFSRRGRR